MCFFSLLKSVFESLSDKKGELNKVCVCVCACNDRSIYHILPFNSWPRTLDNYYDRLSAMDVSGSMKDKTGQS